MLKDGTGNKIVSALGDVFAMKMHNDEMGEYEMSNNVAEFVPNERIVWEPVMTAPHGPRTLRTSVNRLDTVGAMSSSPTVLGPPS